MYFVGGLGLTLAGIFEWVLGKYVLVSKLALRLHADADTPLVAQHLHFRRLYHLWWLLAVLRVLASAVAEYRDRPRGVSFRAWSRRVRAALLTPAVRAQNLARIQRRHRDVPHLCVARRVVAKKLVADSLRISNRVGRPRLDLPARVASHKRRLCRSLHLPRHRILAPCRHL